MKKEIKIMGMIALVGLIGLVIGCSSSDSPTDPINGTDRVAMLTNVGNNLIIPSFKAFETNTAALKSAAAAYSADVTNEQKLTQLQAAWLTTASSWKRASLFSQGPIENGFLIFGIYNPTINTSGIEKAISQTATPINNTYIESLGAPLKGIPAIEYLIFNKGDNASILNNYKGVNGGARTAYLQALCENLELQATKVLSQWSPDGGNYIKDFIAADGRDINSSFGILSNKMIDLIYTIKDERLGAPIGKRNSSTPQPDLVDGPYSNESLALMKAELMSLEYTFSGKNLSGSDGAGFDDILDKVGAKSGDELLSAKIKGQFAVIYLKLNALNKPLSTAVVSDAAAVSALYDEVKRLQVLMEVDMINNLGVLLTFSDNDGD